MQTKNLAEEKFKQLQQLFPNAVTETTDEEGNVVKAIDKDILMQEISSEVVEGSKERYQFTWPDKKKAVHVAGAPTSNTLRPCREESVNFDETENLYIEGDNLEVLKLLQETYLGRVKMIYIDPPYNTGKDFVYNDEFKSNYDEYIQNSGQLDEEGNRLEKNLESNGRFHTDWLNMIYPRLKLARNLLTDDGVIFISIDDNEQANLVKLCNEIFGENNFIATIIIDGTPKNDPLLIATSHEYMLGYFKNRDKAKMTQWGSLHSLNKEMNDIVQGKEKSEAEEALNSFFEDNDLKNDNISHYKYVDKDGIYRIGPIDDPQSKGPRDNRINPKTGNYLKIPTRGWSCKVETWNKWKKENLIEFPDTDDKLPAKKTYLTNEKYEVGRSVRKIQGRKATSDLKRMFDKTKIFNHPKPIQLLKDIIQDLNDEEAIILDFFSGSSSTAHAVMDLNADDGGNRNFIMVQLPEETDEKSKAFKVGYKTIAEIGKERIRRAGNKILEDHNDKDGIENLDIGFRVLKTDSSNMKDVYYSPSETQQDLLDMLEDNIKEDRSAEDLLFQVMLDLGISLSSKIKVETIDDTQVHIIEDGFLIACFDKNIDEEIVEKIAKQTPYYAIFRDSSIANDSVAANFEQIFESISPETIRKVL